MATPLSTWRYGSRVRLRAFDTQDEAKKWVADYLKELAPEWQQHRVARVWYSQPSQKWMAGIYIKEESSLATSTHPQRFVKYRYKFLLEDSPYDIGREVGMGIDTVSEALENLKVTYSNRKVLVTPSLIKDKWEDLYWADQSGNFIAEFSTKDLENFERGIRDWLREFREARTKQIWPSAHPLILRQYPLGQVPEKMPINMDIPIPPLRGTKVAPRTQVVVPENAALRTNVELDRAVEHLGYQSVSLSEEEVAGLEKPIPTDIELINESQRRLRRLKVIPDGQLNTRQLAHLKLARVLAQTICYRNPLSGVYAASIPPASDRVRTVGTYGTKNKAGYIALDSLDTGRITIDTLIHELGHHRQYLKTGEAEDLEIEHAEAMTSIAGEAVAIVGTGKLDKLLVDVAW